MTEIRVYNDKGAQMSSYLIGLAAKDGVFVLSVSPAKKNVDPLVKELVSSFKLVPRNLDAEETKRLSSEAKRSVKRTSNKSLNCDGRTHSTANQRAKSQACPVREAPHRDQLHHQLGH